jgi:hypothetical protein
MVLLVTSQLVSESLPPLDPLHKETVIPFEDYIFTNMSAK